MLFTLLGIVILAGAAGDISVTRGMKAVGEVKNFRPAALLRSGVRIFQNGFIWLGIFCKTIAFFGFLALLSRADLSWAVPAGSSSYVVDSLAAKYLLHEKISRTRWAGALCVGLGVALISL
jgi:uncharacterized membrane protein